MSTNIARVYDSYGDALDASNALKTKGFGDGTMNLISKASNVSGVSAEEISKEIASAGIPADDVAAYASAVDEGKSLLVVRAGFGMAVRAMKVTGGHNPASGREYYLPTIAEKPASASASASSSSFFLSSWLNWPLLTSGSTPFSSWFNWPVLINDPAPFSRILNWSTVAKKPFTFSEPKLKQGFTFGEPKLTNSATVLSDKLNMPVLLKGGPEK